MENHSLKDALPCLTKNMPPVKDKKMILQIYGVKIVEGEKERRYYGDVDEAEADDALHSVISAGCDYAYAKQLGIGDAVKFLPKDFPYVESTIQAQEFPDAIYKRPGMYFGEMDSGDAYASIIAQIIEGVLSWKVGARLNIALCHNNEIIFECIPMLPGGVPVDITRRSRKPVELTGSGTPKFKIGSPFSNYEIPIDAYACRVYAWELRDDGAEICVELVEGVCQKASNSAPSLPSEQCLRVSVAIGTERLPIVAGTVEQIEKHIKRFGEPYLPCGVVCIDDRRNGIKREIVVRTMEFPRMLNVVPKP